MAKRKSPTAPPPATLTPAPPDETRAAGERLFPEITHARKRAFLLGFVQTGSRVQAGKIMGSDDRIHWHWLEHDPTYAAAFAKAERIAADRVEDRLYTLALEGTTRGVYHQGVKVAEEGVVYPTLILATLNAAKPEKYTYRSTVEHTIHPALLALHQQWQQARELATSQPPALPAPAIDAEFTPLPSPPDATHRAHTFTLLDRLNQRRTDDGA